MEPGAIIKHDIKKAPKTGDWRYMRPEVDKTKCIGCGTCVKFCPEAAINLESQNVERGTKIKSGSTINDTRYADVDYDWCKGCGVCAVECPKRQF